SCRVGVILPMNVRSVLAAGCDTLAAAPQHEALSARVGAIPQSKGAAMGHSIGMRNNTRPPNCAFASADTSQSRRVSTGVDPADTTYARRPNTSSLAW